MATRTEQIEGRGDPRLGKAHRGAQHSCCDASHHHVSPMRATTAYLLTSSPQSSLVPAGGKERWHRATQVRHSSHSLLLPSSRSSGVPFTNARAAPLARATENGRYLATAARRVGTRSSLPDVSVPCGMAGPLPPPTRPHSFCPHRPVAGEGSGQWVPREPDCAPL